MGLVPVGSVGSVGSVCPEVGGLKVGGRVLSPQHGAVKGAYISSSPASQMSPATFRYLDSRDNRGKLTINNVFNSLYNVCTDIHAHVGLLQEVRTCGNVNFERVQK